MNEEEAIEYIEQFIGIKKEYKCKPIKVKTLNNTREAIETVLNLLEKKDKMIDELEDIFYNYQLCEYELTDCTYRKCEYIADDEIPPCKECIKQYFEREVENEN